MRRTFPVFLIPLIACGPFFYQAPPTLGTYPERVAAKRWQHIFAEAAPPDPALPGAPALDESCRKLPELLTPLDPAKRFAEIDRLLAENRGGPYSSRRANFLHELRELAADDALFTAAKSYIGWRVDHDAVLPSAPPAERPWDMEEEEFKNRRQLYEFQLKQRLTFFKEQLAKADPLMEPYWEIRRAALFFDTGDLDAAAAGFSSVIENFPDHPRAEVASLMLARCTIEQPRALRRAGPAEGRDEEIRTLLDEAETMLTEFIENHPKGRFTPDAEGWLGAIAFERNQYGAAVKYQLARLDLQPTREITGTVLRECDRIFKKLIESREADEETSWIEPQEQFDAAAVARHPLVARLFVQHCIDPAAHISLPMWWDDSESGGRGTIDFLKRRILNPKPFVRLALNELGKELVKARSRPDATTLTLLAWAATEDGEHEQALALLDQITSPALTDEAMQARAIVLQRLGRHADAVSAFDTLAKTWPASPLVNDLPYRRSISLFRSGQAGKAILEILPLVFPKPPPPEGAEVPSDGPPALHPDQQLVQWLDALVQFAPLDQLEIAFAGVGDDVRQRDLLREAIRTRALAAGRFELAERHLSEDPPAEDAAWDGIGSALADKRRMTRADWDAHVAPLAKLAAELAKSPPADGLAGLHLAIARQWMQQRGVLALPSLSLCYFAGSEEEKQDLLRRKNALELGFPRDVIERELDHRDEAAHALEYALEAAKSTDAAIAAPALELANQCLFRRAEFSLYQKSRALETGATQLSADIHRQLRGRFPDSPEAKRSVFFTFTPGAGPWMPGDYNSYNAAAALISTVFGYPMESPPEDAETTAKIAALPAPFANVDAKTPLAAIRRDLEAAMRELTTLRTRTNPEDQSDVIQVINRLDDLLVAASLPDIRTEDFRNYANGGTDALPPPFKSLLDFRGRLIPATDADGGEHGPRNDTIDGWRGFLETWPDSPKAEAASFRLTRLIARKYRSDIGIHACHFPDAPVPNGYKFVQVGRMDPANDPAEVLAAIGQHETRFPMGRYRDDLNLLRAGALIDSGKYSQALALLGSILGNPSQGDLHVLAALDFADICQRLLDPEQRAAVAKAIRRSPGAMDRLRLLVDGDTFLSRLKPLMPWLEDG